MRNCCTLKSVVSHTPTEFQQKAEMSSERIAFTGCVNNERLFALSRGFGSQTSAVDACVNEFQATLGPIRNELEFTEIINAVRVADPLIIDLENVDYLIGLEAKNGQNEDGGNTSVFSFIDESDNEGLDFFHGDQGEFPWDSRSQPNNANGVQNCAASRYRASNNFSGLVNDLPCERDFQGAICRTACSNTEIDISFDDVLFKVVLEN